MWEKQHREVFEESVLVIPGVIACIEREDVEGARILTEGVITAAYEQHQVPPCVSWSIMFSASIHWLRQATAASAKARKMPIEQHLQQMGAFAAAWQSSVQ